MWLECTSTEKMVRVHRFRHGVIIDTVVDWGGFEPEVSFIDPVLILLADNHDHLFSVLLQKLEERNASELLVLEPFPHQVRELIIQIVYTDAVTILSQYFPIANVYE